MCVCGTGLLHDSFALAMLGNHTCITVAYEKETRGIRVQPCLCTALLLGEQRSKQCIVQCSACACPMADAPFAQLPVHVVNQWAEVRSWLERGVHARAPCLPIKRLRHITAVHTRDKLGQRMALAARFKTICGIIDHLGWYPLSRPVMPGAAKVQLDIAACLCTHPCTSTHVSNCMCSIQALLR